MVENLGRIWRSRRKELERERGRILSHDIRDVHASKSIFVPAATFGQLTKHIFDHGGGSHPNSDSRCQQAFNIFLSSGKSGRQNVVSLVSRHTFAFVLVRVVPSGSRLPPNRAKGFPSRRRRRSISWSSSRPCMLSMPDYGHVERPSPPLPRFFPPPPPTNLLSGGHAPSLMLELHSRSPLTKRSDPAITPPK